MNFANPWALWGMLAAAIPVLVHLFDRRRPRPHPFGAIAFVMRSQKRTASRLKLKRLLLYTLRTLVFLCVPLALARPSCAPDATAASLTRGPAATAIVLDASLSMRLRADGNPIYEDALDEARAAIGELLPEEPATLVRCGVGDGPPEAPGFDRQRLLSQLDRWEQAGEEFADLNHCLTLAARALDESPLPGRRLVLISDFAAHGFRLESPAPTSKDPQGADVKPEVVLRRVGPEEQPGNAAVVALAIEPAPQAGPGAFQLTATVPNASSQALKDAELSLQVGGVTLAKSFLDVPAGGTVRKSLTHRFEQQGAIAGAMVLAADALPEDNARAFVLQVAEPISVLVVNGAPAAQRYRDETFFLEPALTAPGTPVRSVFRDAEAGLKEDLSAYDVVFLVNVPAPDPEAASRLAAFVEKGGGLFVSMGDQVSPDAYNAVLGELLPRRLRDVRTAAEREDADVERRAGRITQLQRDHPLLAPFSGEAAEGLEDARFYRYVLFEGGNQEGGTVLAAFQDGAPALLIGQRGRGRVALFASTVDRDWADLAIRTAFLPLMQRTAAYLGGGLEERERLQVRVGTTLTLSPPEGVRVGAVEGPMKNVPFRAAEDGSVVVGPLRVPGAYVVKDLEGKVLPSLGFAATLGTEETDLARVQRDALQAWFGEETVTTAGENAEGREVPVWTWLLVVAALAFLGEGLLLRR